MNNNDNNINLQEQMLKLYLNDASNEELIEIGSLLEHKKYDLIFGKVDEYTKKILYKKDYKQIETNGDNGGEIKCIPVEIDEKQISTEDMDPQTFELYCILVLVDKYLKEKDENKKRILEDEINNALYYYRSHKTTEQKSL